MASKNFDSSERHKRRICICSWCCCLLAWVIMCVVFLFGFGVIKTSKPTPATTRSTEARELNYTECVGGWTTPGLFESTLNEANCSTLTNANNCSTTLHCCWNASDDSCGTFLNEPDCSVLKTVNECAEMEFCAWRNTSTVTGCRRAHSLMEYQIQRRYDACSARWNVTLSELRCDDFSNKSCPFQFGCCSVEAQCKPVLFSECLDRKTQSACESLSAPPSRPSVCRWTASGCIRSPPQLPTRSPSSPPPSYSPVFTRYPTIRRPTAALT